MGLKSRGGRPTRPETVGITFHVDPEIKQALAVAAARSGLSLSQYIRHQVLGFVDVRRSEAQSEITLGTAPPETWGELNERIVQRQLSLNSDINRWIAHLERNDKTREVLAQAADRGMTLDEYRIKVEGTLDEWFALKYGPDLTAEDKWARYQLETQEGMTDARRELEIIRLRDLQRLGSSRAE